MPSVTKNMATASASEMPQVPCIRLGGSNMPVVGLGTWKSEPDEIKDAVRTALDVGYRHIDCAAIYGNEQHIGMVLKERLEAGGLRREELFITSKLWNTFHAREHVKPALLKTLKDLNLDYLDLYLMHWPTGFQYAGDEMQPKNSDGTHKYSDIHYKETWGAMEECVREGLVRNIGLSNFNKEQVQDVFSFASIKPSVLQCECHPFLPQLELSGLCKDLGMVYTAYSPLGSPDRPWASEKEEKLMDHPKVKAIAKAHKKSAAQVLIRYQIQRGHVVIPKSATPERIEANLQVFDFALSEDEMENLTNDMPTHRFCVPKSEKLGKSVAEDGDHPLFPFHEWRR